MYTYKYKDLALALYEALISDPFYIELLREISGGEPEKREILMRYMDYSMTEGEKYGQLTLAGDPPYGAAIWSRPLEPAIDNEKSLTKKDFIKTYMGEPALKAYSTIVSFMSEQLDTLLQDAWYLSIAGIKPTRQGQGLGANLLMKVLNETDKNGISTYLETFTPRNIRFYERMGYKITKEVSEPVTGRPYWIMVREPLR
ncbi:GNAT family N-acetyltransferase [Mucilaginibacter gossypii]|uniref:GNAT family N-acetyltransferase n=1 Tax=Mucilaginibacter gossypii TaxID=551996 RepID=UPI000DCF10D7|nr:MULTISPECIES: GNAT family N-acetyltransferase [Mucilaginibacter]QTE36707.1 GNAT family N-acetyltransferase [Mucilaginibacter gossypii]RAV55547.1 N-acetyltransferase [Mucilaginibacter rubeus]